MGSRTLGTTVICAVALALCVDVGAAEGDVSVPITLNVNSIDCAPEATVRSSKKLNWDCREMVAETLQRCGIVFKNNKSPFDDNTLSLSANKGMSTREKTIKHLVKPGGEPKKESFSYRVLVTLTTGAFIQKDPIIIVDDDGRKGDEDDPTPAP